MTHETELFSVATYENNRFTGYLSSRGRTAWTLPTAYRLAKDFTERHPGTTATVKSYFNDEA